MTLDEEIKKLKKQVKDLKLQAKHDSDRAYKWLQYSEDLEAKLQVASDRLRVISSNSYYTTEGSSRNEASYNAQLTASYGLRIIGAMKARKP